MKEIGKGRLGNRRKTETMNRLYAIILAGGAGERFWPLSTPERPKQFLALFGGRTLIRQAYERVAKLVPDERILVITAKELVQMTRDELPELPLENVIGEPCRRNTAPAVAVALGEVLKRGGEKAVGAILTADQLMTRPAVFRSLLRKAVCHAVTSDDIVTLGVRPDRPATGYGYIETALPAVDGTLLRVVRFKEKPDAATARKYLRSGRFVWNAGMFIWRAETLRRTFASVAPELEALSEAVRGGSSTVRTLARRYPELGAISFDYAVMEKISNIAVVAGDFGWDDVGSFSSIEKHFPADSSGNVVIGDARLVDAQNVSAVARGVRIALMGVKDLVVVTSGNNVLICSKDRVQDLRRLKVAEGLA